MLHFLFFAEYVHLPAPWGRAEVLRNMPALKFYHDLTSEVHTFNMAWGPCWEPAWSQVLALRPSIKLLHVSINSFRNLTTKKQCPSWPTGREVMTTSSCWVRGYNSTPSPTVQSTPVNRTVERDSAVSGY